MSARANAAIVAVALAFGLGGYAASRWWFGPAPAQAPMSLQPVADVGDPAPELALDDLDGRRRALAEWRGRPTLVNFWATWCAPCLREMPLLDARAKADPALAIVGIALDEPEAVRRFVRQLGVGYPVLLDLPGANDASVALGNRRGVLPYSVLLDADGTILAQEAGDFADTAELEAFLARSNVR